MCYASASSPGPASIIERADRIMTVACVALIILLIAGCGPRIQMGQGAKMEIKAEGGSTVNVGTRQSNVPVSTILPPIAVP